MSRIAAAFSRRPGNKALIPFLNAGDPDFDTSLALFREVLRAGADIVEIGTPYSDPLADGPVIQASAVRSIQAGFRFPQVFELATALRSEFEQALVLFTYFNPVLQYGIDRFFTDAQSAGADGVIIPDLPFEESQSVREVADQHGVDLVPLIAPTSSEARVTRICEQARGFVYCVSSLGVTGERAKMSNRLENLVAIAKAHTNVPVAVGFGVRGPEQTRELVGYADGVIIGSAYVRRIADAVTNGLTPASRQAALAAVGQFTQELSTAMDGFVPENMREGVVK